jgi:nucleoside-diphosphate-sugar epimerase
MLVGGHPRRAGWKVAERRPVVSTWPQIDVRKSSPTRLRASINVGGTNVLEAAHGGHARVVFISTGAIYGEGEGKTPPSRVGGRTARLRPEQFAARATWRLYGALRSSSVAATRQRSRPAPGPIGEAGGSRSSAGSYAGRAADVFGDGTQTRDSYTWATCAAALRGAEATGPVNVGTDRDQS